MIKLENTITPSPEQMEFVIQGMRNPMNSWDKSDSTKCKYGAECDICKHSFYTCNEFSLGENDWKLMRTLARAGSDHRKFMRMMPVYVRITAPLYWWKEFDTYKVGTVSNSCSTMHKITEKEFTLEDFSCEHLVSSSVEMINKIIKMLNDWRDIYLHADDLDPDLSNGKTVADTYNMSKKDIWWQIIQLLPSSYNQTRNIMLNYEVLRNIYKSRKDHKLNEWLDFCKWIEKLVYSELITGPIILTKDFIV